MASSFEKESKALIEAVHGRPVNYSDVQENLTYVKGETGSANHKMGSNPAWWLDCQRRGEGSTVTKGLDWCEWYAGTPLYENESGCVHAPYRVRMDQGTYALAMLAHFANREDLRDALLRKCRLSVGLALLGAFTGDAKKLVKNNPQPADKAVLLIADGPLLPLAGNDGSVPHIAGAGMRSKVRDGDTHTGPVGGLDDPHLRVLVAQALTLPHKRNGTQSEIFETIRSRSGMPPWGLTGADVQMGRDFLADPLNANLAVRIHSWLHDAPLPKLPYAILHRASGAVEFVQLRSHDSSTGALQCEVVSMSGTRYLGSADDGMRGGQNSSAHIQPQEAVEYPDKWVCRWLSGQGEVVEVPRPENDQIVWRVNIAGGHSTFEAGGVVNPPDPGPTPPDPGPEPPMQGAPLVYLGKTGVPGEYLYGSHDPDLIVREIHGDPASGYPKRWIAE